MTKQIKHIVFCVLTCLSAFLFIACRHSNPCRVPDLSRIPAAPAAPTVIYMPGFRFHQGILAKPVMTMNRRGEEITWLKRAFPGSRIIYLDWVNDVPWELANNNAENVVEELVKTLLSLPKGKRENIIFAGHSLGGRSVVEVLSYLHKHGAKIKRGILLAAAITVWDPHLKNAVQASVEPVINVYCPEDGVLRMFFGISEKGSALGASGVAIPEITGKMLQYRVAPHFTGGRMLAREKWFNNHWSTFYLEVLPDIITGKRLPQPPSYPFDGEIGNLHPEEGQVLHFLPETGKQTVWQDEKRVSGWRFQRNLLRKDYYRILDPWDMMHFSGKMKETEKKFDSIIKKLVAKEKKISPEK